MQDAQLQAALDESRSMAEQNETTEPAIGAEIETASTEGKAADSPGDAADSAEPQASADNAASAAAGDVE